MSLFISKENQNLLYEMINKTPEINTVFSSIDEKNRWFRKTIESHYTQLPQNITREVLLATNRQVLSSMVEQLRVAYANKPVVNNLQDNYLGNQPVIPINNLKRDNAPNIEQIQSQYKSMFEVPKPQKIDFSEKLDDDVITNMDELIENQKRMRERELQEYSPPPPTKINILEDLPKDVIKTIPERRVQFDIPAPLLPQLQTHSFSEEITKRIDRLEDKMDQLISLFMTNQTNHKPPIITEEPNKKDNITILKQLINEDL
jgi:hypothetical protein